MNINKAKLYENFIDIEKISNVNILKCHKELFTQKGILYNIGCLVTIIVIIFHIICIFTFYIKQLGIITNNIKDIIFALQHLDLIKSEEKNDIMKQKENLKINKKEKTLNKNKNNQLLKTNKNNEIKKQKKKNKSNTERKKYLNLKNNHLIQENKIQPKKKKKRCGNKPKTSMAAKIESQNSILKVNSKLNTENK